MSLLNYLGHASLFLACLYGIYWLFFRKEVFHQLNRALLLLIIAGSLVLPMIPAPSLYSNGEGLAFEVIGWASTSPAVLSKPKPYALETKPTKKLAGAGDASRPPIPLSLGRLATLSYFVGLALLAVRLCLQLFSVFRLLNRGAWKREEGGWLVSSDEFHTPFSFWNVIFIPEKYVASPPRQHILEHERVHRRQWHSADLLAAELFCLFFWFHPAAWWLNRALRAQLEYIADEAVLNAGANPKAYQYSLLSLSCRNTPFRLANQFNHSLIKTRIVMMNAKKSPAHHKLKYLMALPLAFLSVLMFNDAQAQVIEVKPDKEVIEVKPEGKDAGEIVEVKPEGAAASETAGSVGSSSGRATVGLGTAHSAKGEVVVGLGSSSSVGSSNVAVAGLGKSPYESVFVAIGAEFPVERLPQMEKDLEEQGILLDIEELDYNADKLITQLKLSVRTTDGKMHGNGFSYNDGKPIDKPVIFYVRRGEGNYGFGIFTGEMNDKVPAEVRGVIERMENGYFVGKVLSE